MQLLLFLWLAAVPSAHAEAFSLSRYFTVKTCFTNSGCVGPTAKSIESANQRIDLEPFHKSGLEGLDGWERTYVASDGVLFHAEIHVIKYAHPGKYKYYIYTMLRSGKREGKIKKVFLKELEDFKEFTISDRPIKTKNGTAQVQLVVGPTLTLDYKEQKK